MNQEDQPESTNPPIADSTSEPATGTSLGAKQKRVRKQTSEKTAFKKLHGYWTDWNGKSTDPSAAVEEILSLLQAVRALLDRKELLPSSAAIGTPLKVQLRNMGDFWAALGQKSPHSEDDPASNTIPETVQEANLPAPPQNQVEGQPLSPGTPPIAEDKHTTIKKNAHIQQEVALPKKEFDAFVAKVAEVVKSDLGVRLESSNRRLNEIDSRIAGLRKEISDLMATSDARLRQSLHEAMTIHEKSFSGALEREALLLKRVLQAGLDQIGQIEKELAHRISLKDAQEVMRLRSDVERHVRADLIRSISRTISPTLDALLHVREGGNPDQINQAVSALGSKCIEAGLITDLHKLF